MTEREYRQLAKRLNAVIGCLDVLSETDVVCEVHSDSVVICIDASIIESYIHNACSLRVWLDMVDNEISYETGYRLKYNLDTNEVTITIREGTFTSTDDIVSDFVCYAETILETIDFYLNKK